MLAACLSKQATKAVFILRRKTMKNTTQLIRKCLPALALISSSLFLSPAQAQNTMTFQDIYNKFSRSDAK